VDTFEFRVHALDKVTSDKKPISMWHDIKLYPTDEARAHNVVNMVNEIPRCSRKKYEIATNECKSYSRRLSGIAKDTVHASASCVVPTSSIVNASAVFSPGILTA
jgi:hypothetical protein